MYNLPTIARASWLFRKPAHNIYVTCIGGKGCGKTTALCFLAEILDQENFAISHARNEQPNTVVLVDNLTWEAWQEFAKREDTLTIKLRYKPFDSQPTSCAVTEFFIENYGEFRLLKFQLKDLFMSEIVNHKRWKAAFGGK